MKITTNQLNAALDYQLHKNSSDDLERYRSSARAQLAGVMQSPNELKPEISVRLNAVVDLVQSGEKLGDAIHVALKHDMHNTNDSRKLYEAYR